MANSYLAAKQTLEAVTVYVSSAQQIILEELRLKLRRQGIKVSKSKLVRVALKLLGEQDVKWLITNLKLDQAE